MSERGDVVLASRRSQTFMIGLLVLLVSGLVAGLVHVPLVALGPGPTYDTLGEDKGKAIVTINGHPTYPTSGHLNLTTVQVADELTALRALRFWADSHYQVVDRSAVYPSGKSDAQVEQENARQFASSEANAAAAALSYLKLPVKVLVGEMSPGAPAAGVLKEGDRLLAVNGQPVTDPTQVSSILMATRPHDRVVVSFQRGAAVPTVGVVTVGARPPGPSGAADGPQGFFGITPEGVPVDANEVAISLGDIGGPSAGLMFALAVVDKLTPGELTGGRFVAGTGQINSMGLVSRIGGVPLKMFAARQAGATVFLVPEAICAEARSAAPSGLQLVKVATLADAVDGLNALREGRTPPTC